MSKYKEIKGFKVQTLASDTAASVAATGSWSSSGALNTARTGGGLAGSLTAGLYFGGNTPPSSQLTETYNGTSWSEVNDMTETARDQMYGFGTQTAAISAAGVTGATGLKSKLVESWDGTSWTAGTDNNTARQAGGSAGKAQNAGLIYGGKDGSGPGNTDNADTESWNGSAWTELNNLNTAGAYMAGGGTYTSALCSVGGNRPAQNESWDGTSWSEISEQNTYRDQSGGAADSNTSGLIYGGEAPPVTAITESWDGTTWTEVADMGTARSIGSGASGGQSGGASSALGVGGQIAPGARSALTEEWTTTATPTTLQKTNLGQVYYNSGSNAFKVTQLSAPAGTWASAANLSTARASSMGAGSQTAAIAGMSSGSTNTEIYDGSSWTEVNNNNTQRGVTFCGGTSTAALGAGGYTTTNVAITELWNGSTWTEVNDLNTARRDGSGGNGTSTALIIAGGSGGDALTESWNGTSWTEVNDLNNGRITGSQFGTSSDAGIFVGGGPSSPSYRAYTELWDGTSWTETTDLSTGNHLWVEVVLLLLD